MPNAPQSRKTFKISDSLNRKLNTYAQVAAAAGVSVLALSGASEAEVVYTETNQVTHSGLPLYIDLNHDGINDFQLQTLYYRGTSGIEIGLNALGIAGNQVAGVRIRTSGGYFFSAASALPVGAQIGPRSGPGTARPSKTRCLGIRDIFDDAARPDAGSPLAGNVVPPAGWRSRESSLPQ
jgi:hypothetical protein